MIPADTNRPVPAAIDGRQWTVRPSQSLTGGTDMRRAELFAPLADTPTARMIRNHELIHARITPRLDPGAAVKKYGATVDALQWSEDWRVSRAMYRRGLCPDDCISPPEADMLAANMAGSPRGVAAALLANWFAVDARKRLGEAFVRAGVPSEAVAQIETTVAEIVAAAAAPHLPKRRGRGQGHFERPSGFGKITAPLARLFDAMFPEGAQHAPGRPGAAVERVPGLTRWGRLIDIVVPDMPSVIRPRRAPGRRYSDCGVVPSAVHRWPVDGAIFGIRRRQKGGTILCDASGSMNYTDDDIQRILENAPASTIAFYSGTGAGRNSFGKVVIGARGGRCATVESIGKHLVGGGNIIDGPALRWLAKQPGPLVWVSDEEVGGGGADYGKGGPAHQECLLICRAANVRIVPSIDALR